MMMTWVKSKKEHPQRQELSNVFWSWTVEANGRQIRKMKILERARVHFQAQEELEKFKMDCNYECDEEEEMMFS
jgi:hypothetical protein